MAKRKKGRLRGKGGHQSNGSRNQPRMYREPYEGPRGDYDAQPDNGEPGPVEAGGGVLELHPNGYGFLRDPTANYIRQMTDPFVPGSMIEKFGLREGVHVRGMVQAGRRQQGPR